MSKIPLYALLDLDSIKRWHMVNTSVVDTVAAHSFRVALIAMAIHEEIGTINECKFNTSVRDSICHQALMHDSAETYTGDIATHTKDKMKAAGVDVDAVCGADGHAGGSSDYIQTVIKAADIIDAVNFITIHGVGPRADDAKEYNIVKFRNFLGSCDPIVREAVLSVQAKIKDRRSFL